MKFACVLSLAVAAASLPVAAGEMRYSFAETALPAAGKIVIPVGKGGALSGAAADADARTNGAISRAIAAAAFKGGMGKTLALYGLAPFDAVLLVGTGDGIATAAELQDLGAEAAGTLGKWDGAAAFAVPDVAGVEDDAAQVALGLTLGDYEYAKILGPSDKEDEEKALAVTFHGPGGASWATDRAHLAEAVTMARDLMWTPSNIKTPAWFAAQVVAAFDGVPNTRVRVLDVEEMQALGMGGILGVGMGSSRPPRMIAVTYDSPDYDGAPLAFVGKGITFDTGGISLKPNTNMWKMRQDMTGAAVSAATVLAMAKRGAKVDAVAVLAMAENMPGGRAQRPGDVVTTMSGKTFEIISTDAEGRMVLTDGLWWAQEEFQPRLAVTVATLTGSVERAVGDEFGGLFTEDDALADLFLDAGEIANEQLWRLPLHESYLDALKSDVADLKHSATGEPGASIGATFIKQWAQEDVPFVHLDIAGRDWAGGSDRPTEPKGATAYGVRLLDEVARRYEAE